MEQDEAISKSLIDDWHMQDDSFDYYNDNDNDNESDFDDYEESKRKKKRTKGGKKKAELNPDDKPFVCDKCGVKYKTKPGLSYHIHKMHTNNSNANNTNTSSMNNSSHNASSHHSNNNTTHIAASKIYTAS